jgi:hypothetical protein
MDKPRKTRYVSDTDVCLHVTIYGITVYVNTFNLFQVIYFYHEIYVSPLLAHLCYHHHHLLLPLMLYSFDWLAAFHLDLLQAILFIAV